MLRSVLHEERHVQHEPRHAVTDGGIEGSEEHLTNPGVDPPLEFLPGLLILEHPGCERGSIDASVRVQHLSPVARDDPGDDLGVLEGLVGGVIRGDDPPARAARAAAAADLPEAIPPRTPKTWVPGLLRGRRPGSRGRCSCPQKLGNRGPPRNSAREQGSDRPESAGSVPRVRPGVETPWWLPARAGVPRALRISLPTPSTSGASLSGGLRSVIT